MKALFWELLRSFIFLTLAANSIASQQCPSNIMKLEVLPGRGWDGLRNKEMGMVLDMKYDTCRITEDGQYLIPDEVYITALKESNLQITSELIEHWLNYSCITASSFSFDIGGSVLFGAASVQGSFDINFRDAKRRQVEEKSVTTRTQVRNTLYRVQSSPSAKIDPKLMEQFNLTIAALRVNNDEKAEVLLEFLVRDYGTHYIMQADAGALLVGEDFISRSFVKSDEDFKIKVSAAAGDSFLKIFYDSTKMSMKVDAAFAESYDKQKTSKHIKVFGGGMVRDNMTIDQWIDKIPNNLVVIDRVGNPLTYLITPERFPGVELPILMKLEALLNKVITNYYSYNTHKGCMNVSSLNFDYNANVQDGFCKPPAFNYSFGGVYVTCESHSVDAGDLCKNFPQKNPLTGSLSCPQHYQAIPLTSGTLRDSRDEQKQKTDCISFLLFSVCETKYWKEHKTSESEYRGYWCAAVDKIPTKTGYMFGGVYTSWKNNPIGQAQKCPKAFIALNVSADLKVCVSDDYELGYPFSVPFAGFFSCNQGNPLNPKLSSGKEPDPYMHGCPTGFSQHTAVIENGCEINYCTGYSKEFSSVGIVLPPFRDRKSLFMKTELMGVLEPSTKVSTTTVNGGAIAGVVIGCLVAIVAVIASVFYLRRRHRRYRNTRMLATAEQESLLPEQQVYGSINEEA